MANETEISESSDAPPSRTLIRNFRIDGLLGRDAISLDFPDPLATGTGPAVLILSGRNGSGKTTILRMIGGMLAMDFNEFRRIPFDSACLTLSSGQKLTVLATKNTERPIAVTFENRSAILAMDKEQPNYSQSEQADIEQLRSLAVPVLRGVRYELVELDRIKESQRARYVETAGGRIVAQKEDDTLANKVREFLRDAQVNYNRFFRAEEFSFLPNLLERLKDSNVAPDKSELLERIDNINSKAEGASRFGLYVNTEQLGILRNLLENGPYQKKQHMLLIETYIEAQESAQRVRDLLADRLKEFESTLNAFFVEKRVFVDRRKGLRIYSGDTELSELQLSSGERHFLSMMVVALLCQREGTVIAIDEPELSLHISWQRKIIAALTKCAAGASPLFLFATHSLAISAEYSDRVYRLSRLD